ncbi:MAG: anthranilate synthase component I [Alphaproteobacteria bacterium]|nr:MAG: anthranilate synthase component I [Alphaproteobacteria bacterium]
MLIQPSFSEFEASFQSDMPQVVWTRLIADLETPVSAMMKLTNGQSHCFLYESVQGGEIRGRYSIIGLKPDLIWRCRDGIASVNDRPRVDPDAFEPCDKPALDALRDLIDGARIDLPDELPPMAAGVFGYLGYDMVRLMENLPTALPDPLGVPDAELVRPTICAIFDNIRDEIIVVTPVRPGQGQSARGAYAQACERLTNVVSDLERSLPRDDLDEIDFSDLPEPVSNTPHEEYLEIVRKAKEYIKAGDIFQVVPSQRFRQPFKLPPFALYRALRRLNPSPFLYFMDHGDFCIVGSSPEILVRLRDDTVTIRPIAGTRKRGDTPQEDQRMEEELLGDPKEIAEHLMLLDLGRNDTGRVSKPGTVKVTHQFEVERYSHVMHIVSNVEGEIDRSKYDAVSALVAGFPAGTVSGAPKVRAMEIIDELEKEKRGIYAGAVGYFSANGSMDTCIVLRTALVKDGMMYVQAGGGVVYDSDPEFEHQECVNKSKALFSAAQEAHRFSKGNR